MSGTQLTYSNMSDLVNEMKFYKDEYIKTLEKKVALLQENVDFLKRDQPKAARMWGDKDGSFFNDMRDYIDEYAFMCAPKESNAYKRAKDILDRIENVEKSEK